MNLQLIFDFLEDDATVRILLYNTVEYGVQYSYIASRRYTLRDFPLNAYSMGHINPLHSNFGKISPINILRSVEQ